MRYISIAIYTHYMEMAQCIIIILYIYICIYIYIYVYVLTHKCTSQCNDLNCACMGADSGDQLVHEDKQGLFPVQTPYTGVRKSLLPDAS